MSRLSAKSPSAKNKAAFAHTVRYPRVGICRILHDQECSQKRGGGQYPYLARNYSQQKVRGLPETVRYNGGSGHVVLDPPYVQLIKQSNSAQAFGYLIRLQSGWVNYGPWPKIEQLGFGGDYVVVTEIVGGKCYIEAYDNHRSPAWYQRDYLQLFTVVYSDDTYGQPDCAPVTTCAIANPGERLWVHDYDLTFVRPLITTPEPVTQHATVLIPA